MGDIDIPKLTRFERWPFEVGGASMGVRGENV